eukprot:318281-Pelagomonas_calceolata.AAC.3
MSACSKLIQNLSKNCAAAAAEEQTSTAGDINIYEEQPKRVGVLMRKREHNQRQVLVLDALVKRLHNYSEKGHAVRLRN